MCVCVCVCVCVRMCVYKWDKPKQQPHAKHNIPYYPSKCDEISEVHKLKILKIYHLYTT